MNIKSIEKRVNAGVRWLDKNRKGWLGRINLRKLDLGNRDTCIIGELDGDYSDTFSGEKEEKAIKLGFNTENDKEFSVLTQVWFKKIIDLRLKKGIKII